MLDPVWIEADRWRGNPTLARCACTRTGPAPRHTVEASAGEDGEKDASGARGQSNTRRPHRTDAPTPPEYREAPTASDHIGKVLPASSCLNVVVVPALTESQLSKSYDRDRQHSPRFSYCGLYQGTPLCLLRTPRAAVNARTNRNGAQVTQGCPAQRRRVQAHVPVGAAVRRPDLVKHGQYGRGELGRVRCGPAAAAARDEPARGSLDGRHLMSLTVPASCVPVPERPPGAEASGCSRGRATPGSRCGQRRTRR